VIEELRRLAAHELRERAVRRLVALDLEVGVHGILSRPRREEIGHAGIEDAELADAQAPLPCRLAADGGHEHDGPAARHVEVPVVQIEDRDRHTARGEDGVVGQPRVEDVSERVVRAEVGHAGDHRPERVTRLAVGRLPPPVLDHGPHVLPRGHGIQTGTERRAERKRRHVGIPPRGVDVVHAHERAAYREARFIGRGGVREVGRTHPADARGDYWR
jgi:hypothetical protein